MKVKLLHSSPFGIFEDDINKFIADKIVIDIKYQIAEVGHIVRQVVLIMYEDKPQRPKDMLTKDIVKSFVNYGKEDALKLLEEEEKENG